MNDLESFNEYVEMLFAYWNGDIELEELETNPHFGITKEVDAEMQKDRFY